MNIDQTALGKKFKPFNCEFIRRLGVAVSEMYQTFEENVEHIKVFYAKPDSLIKNFDELLKALGYIAEKLDGLNTKVRCDTNSESRRLRALARMPLGKDGLFPARFSAMLEKAVPLGGSLYLLELYWQVFRFVMYNKFICC